MKSQKIGYNQEIEGRIVMEIVVDAYNEEEQAMGWYYYLQDKMTFPFKAKCVYKRGLSPLKVGESINVIGMADTDECLHDMLVNIDWEDDELSVPLSQLEGISVDVKTQQALNDWHYWLAQGYCF